MRNHDMSVSYSELNWAGKGATSRPASHERSRLAMRAMRRKLVVAIATLMLAAAALVFPLAIVEVAAGRTTTMFFSVLVLIISSYSLAIARLGRTGFAVYIQVAGIFLGGVALSIADPGVVDFGLALIFLAPVHAFLLRERACAKSVWWIMASLAAFGAISVSSLMLLVMYPAGMVSWLGGLGCILVASSQVYAFFNLHHVEGAHDRKQMRAINHLVEHMGDGYLRFSSNGLVSFASRRTEEIFGAPRYELTGDGIFERIHVLDRPNFLKSFSDAMHTGETRIVEARLRKDGPERGAAAPEFVWIEFFLSPVTGREIPQAAWELVALLRDISNRKDHEFEIMAARKLAEEASRSKSRFLASIGHELRTPLNAIVGFSEMMRSGIGGQLDPVHLEYASHIQQSGHHLLEVVNMLLDMSKIEADKFELELASLEPATLAQPCLQIIAPVALKRNVSLVADIPVSLPEFIGDERAFRQILINLLSNAVKFSREGGEVCLRAKRQGQYLNMTITDNGIGMSEEAAKRVGEPFFQAHDGLSRHYEGTGLGLSIVKGLVNLHAGILRIDSTLGEGTTMTVLLPLNGPRKVGPDKPATTPLRRETNEPGLHQWPQQKSIAL